MEECIILGAGLAGASAAWRLALRGEPVTVLERTAPANAQGSSHGSARIFRYAYAEQLYTDLVVRARLGWDELERQSGRELIASTGCVDFGEARAPERLAEVLASAGVDHELLCQAEASARWPQLHFDTPVLWQPGAGVLDPDTTVAAMLDLAVGSGHARVLSEWDAARIQRTATGFRVWSARGEMVEGSRVIVAVGGWLPDLLEDRGLPPALAAGVPALQVRQEQAYHFPYRTPPPEAWPAFIHKRPEIQAYGLPGGRDADFRGQKIAQYNGGPVIGSASAQDGRVSDDNRRRMTEYVAAYLPGLEPTPYAETTCLFTNTPTDDFIIDAVDGVVLVSACSGHGAKFAPLLGEMAADLALGTGSVPATFALPGRRRERR